MEHNPHTDTIFEYAFKALVGLSIFFVSHYNEIIGGLAATIYASSLAWKWRRDYIKAKREDGEYLKNNKNG